MLLVELRIRVKGGTGRSFIINRKLYFAVSLMMMNLPLPLPVASNCAPGFA